MYLFWMKIYSINIKSIVNIRIQLANKVVFAILIKEILIAFFTIINSLIIHKRIINSEPPIINENYFA